MADHAQQTDNARGSRTKRRVAMAIAVFVLCALAIAMVSQTISFNVRSSKASGIVTFGSVTIQALQTAQGPDGKETPIPEIEQMSESMPASRIVRVKNIGEETAYVRVKLSVRAEDGQGTVSPADDLASFVFDDPTWVEKDGWYYFDAPLEPGETTGALITGVRFDVQSAQKRTGNGLVHLDIDAQGVQTRNNAASAFEAEGWPEEAGR